MSPGFQTPIFFYRPYPGSAIADELEASGARLPRSLEDWSSFDLWGAGDWLPPELATSISRHVFYLRQAWDRPSGPWKLPFRWLARRRLARHRFGLPWEWWLSRWLRRRNEPS